MKKFFSRAVAIFILSHVSTVFSMEDKNDILIPSPKGIKQNEKNIAEYLGIDKIYRFLPKGSQGYLTQEAENGDARAAFLLCFHYPYLLNTELKNTLNDLFNADEKTKDPYHAGTSLLLAKDNLNAPAPIKHHITLANLISQKSYEHPLLLLVLSINSLDLEHEKEISEQNQRFQNTQMGLAYNSLKKLADQGSTRAMYFLLYFATAPDYTQRFFSYAYKMNTINRPSCYAEYMPKLLDYPPKYIQQLLDFLEEDLQQDLSTHSQEKIWEEIKNTKTTLNGMHEKIKKKLYPLYTTKQFVF